MLGAGDVEVGSLYEAQKDVFHVFTDIARLGERGGVGDCERHFQDVREVLREVGLAGT